MTTMIGRGEDLERLVGLLADARLVTLTGAGGVGKSRLALALGHRVRPDAGGGVWFVELAKSQLPAATDLLIAQAFGFVGATQPALRDSVIEAIGDRQLVLILDNCEHVLPAAADFVVDALGRCRRLRILATSREPLGVPGERTMRVPSLPVDGAAADLLVARARDADPSFTGGDDASSIATISRRLDGIPLAIELAAAHVRTFGVRELARRLDAHRDLPAAPSRGRVDRHRTMRAALDWSYDQLDDAERLVFEQLAVFRGRFELDAVDAVVAPGVSVAGSHDADVDAVLASLVDKSMVVAGGADPARFRMLEPLREYAAERLAGSDDADRVAARHARYFADLSRRLHEELSGPDELAAAQRLDAARDNLRAAFSTASGGGDATTALMLGAYLTRYAGTRVWSEPWSWCEVALELPGAVDHPLRADALLGASDGAWQLGHHARSVELADAAIALAEPGSPVWRDAHRIKSGAQIWLLQFEAAVTSATVAVSGQPVEVTAATLGRRTVLALILHTVGRPDVQIVPRLLEDARTLGNPTALAGAYHAAGVLTGANDRPLALEYARQAVEIAATAGAVLIEGFALAALASGAADADPLRGARAHLDVAVHYLRVGNHAHLRGFARALLRPLVLLRAYRAAAVVDGATGDQPEFGELAAARSAHIVAARDALGPAFDDAAALGAGMTDDELVAYLDDAITTLERHDRAARGAHDPAGRPMR
jgi:predicted ATPase